MCASISFAVTQRQALSAFRKLALLLIRLWRGPDITAARESFAAIPAVLLRKLHFPPSQRQLESAVMSIPPRRGPGARAPVLPPLPAPARLRRHLARLPAAISTAQPIDILWFRLPRSPGDPEGAQGGFRSGTGLIMVDRGDLWQIAYVLPKGGYQELHAAGLDHLRQTIAGVMPWLGERVSELHDWKQLSLLAVESDRLPRWYREGLLLIGDAAHVMSPVGGNGINYAVQDATAAFNILEGSLRSGRVTVANLAAVQRRREWPTRLTQMVVNQIQDRVLAKALRSTRPFSFPAVGRLMLRTLVLRDLPLRWMGFGVWPVHVRPDLRAAVGSVS